MPGVAAISQASTDSAKTTSLSRPLVDPGRLHKTLDQSKKALQIEKPTRGFEPRTPSLRVKCSTS
jgi:hypothetical protein